MTYMFEVYYKPPADRAREQQISATAQAFGGRLDMREEPKGDGSLGGVCLTYEFADLGSAESAAQALRASGEHVEDIGEYGT